MHELAIMTVDPRIAEMEHQDRETMFNWLQTYERVSGFSDQERWKDNPVTARGQNIGFGVKVCVQPKQQQLTQ